MFNRSGGRASSGNIRAVVLALMGAVVLLFGAWMLWQNWQLTNTTVEANGTVVGFEENTVMGRRGVPAVVYQPVIEFVTAAGQQVTFTDPMGTNPPSYQVGDAVQVIYDPANPTTARDKSSAGMWTVPLVMVAVGAAFIAYGIVHLRRRHNAGSTQPPAAQPTYQH